MKDIFTPKGNTDGTLYVAKKTDRGDLMIDFFDEKNNSNEENPEFLGKSIELSNIKLTIFFVFLGLIILISRVYYLQIHRGDYYNSISQGNKTRKFVIPAVRGVIFDTNNELLVRNIPRFSMFMTVADLPTSPNERIEILKNISELVGVELGYIEEIIDEQKKMGAIYQAVSIKDNLTHSQALNLRIATKEIAGINMEVRQKRDYLGGESFSHIMGYVGKINQDEYLEKKDEGYLLNDYIGKNGIEYTYEDKMRGVNGTEQVEVDALGKRRKVVSITPPISGKNIYLTLDKKLQNEVQKIINDVLQKNNKKRATVVIMDPDTGKILTILSTPTYDNNLFSGGINTSDYEKLINDPNKPLFFRAIAGEYASGSTIKPAWSAVALQEGIIGEWTTLPSTGGISISQWYFPDWKSGGHGRTDVRKAIAESVNTFYYYIGGGYGEFDGLGINILGEYAKKFNIGIKTGVDLPGEQGGFFPSPEWKEDYKNELWYIGDTYHVSIGQGDMLATPLQVAVWTSFFANDGKIFKPMIVGKIGNEEKNEDISPIVLREDFINQEYVEIVKQGMRRGVTQGSSRNLMDLPINVAGKTGTAQWHSEKDNHAWWTGFAPYKDPQIVVTVLVEEGGEGSKIAVPIAKKIFKWWSANMMK